MCFSAQADLVGGIVVGAIGLDVVRHVDHRRGHAMLSSLPLLFAAHQLDEAFVWWSLQGHISAGIGRVALWAYLLFAFVILPIFVPTAVLVMEPPGRRRLIVVPFVVLGAVASAILLGDMIRGPIGATLGDYHVAYAGVNAGGSARTMRTCLG